MQEFKDYFIFQTIKEQKSCKDKKNLSKSEKQRKNCNTE